MARFHKTATGRIPFTAEEEAEWDAFEAEIATQFTEEKETNTRQARNNLLNDSDWTVLPDSPLTTEQKTTWETYRQALRDITAHADFPYLTDADWPTKPE